MKCSKKVCANDKVIVALNTDKDKYLNYETSINGDLIGNVSLRCHGSERLKSFGASKRFNSYDGGYARVAYPQKLVLKDNTSLELIVDDGGELLTNGYPLRYPLQVAPFFMEILEKSCFSRR